MKWLDISYPWVIAYDILANDSIIPGTDRERFAGCREAFAEKGLEIEDDRFIPLSKVQHERYELYRGFRNNPSRCTVMVFSADYYAAEAMAFFAGNRREDTRRSFDHRFRRQYFLPYCVPTPYDSTSGCVPERSDGR